MSRPAKLIIDLSALRHNVTIAKNCCALGGLVAVLKANAYGHGAIEVAFAIEDQVNMFAVSSIEEAEQLRDAGIQKPILLLEGCFNAVELKICQARDFAVVVHCDKQLSELESITLSTPLSVWLKVDSGMHRLGMNAKEAKSAYQRLTASQNVVGEPILMTHMASSDLLEQNYTVQQLDVFNRLSQELKSTGLAKTMKTSIGNSGSILGWPEASSDWARPGIMLYGLSPFTAPHAIADKLKPVMTLKSEVIAVREIAAGERVGYGSTWQASRRSVIATVAIGYGDGYPRNAKSGTPVLVNGNTAYLAGRVSMDMLSIDVTDIAPVSIGDEVTLWGQGLNANLVAEWADTIGYELVTRMPLRVAKTYLSQVFERR